MQCNLPIKSLLMTACLAVAAPSASAQLDLPDRPSKRPAPPSKSVDLPKKPRGNLAESVVGREPNQELEPGTEKSGGLDLPSAPPRKRRPAAPPNASEPAPPPPDAPSAPAPSADAAQFVMAELRRARDPERRFMDQAVQSLLDLEESGLQAARVSLNADHGPLVLVSARVLLSSSAAPDRELVRERLRTRLPNDVCSALVDAFVQLDPVAASPSFLCELLDHKQQGVRAAADRSLSGRNTPDMIPALQSALKSKRTDTRMRALELVCAMNEAAVRPILFERLKDPSARVAMRATLGLALLEGDDVVAALLRRAFGGPWILRDGAYSLLALIEREDTQLAPALDERHVESLLVGLTSSDPFVSGVCASALAGVGFRSASLVDAAWLDRDVPHELVRGISGLAFHSDFSSLLPVATRRLGLISGKSFGNDGPAWLAWWSAEGEGFKARRAHLFATTENATSLVVGFVSTEEIGIADAFRLLGPAAQSPQPAAQSAFEELRLSGAQARDFFALLGREGALAAERMPGVRGMSASAGRELSITIAGRTKSFRFTQGASEPWFEKLVTTAASLRERNRWQRYHNPLQHATAQEMWVAESPWWDEDHSELERDSRLKRMVFDVLPLREVAQRDEGLRELRRIYQDPATVQPDDFAKLVSLMRDESFIGPRARVFLDLLLHHIEATDAVNARAQVLATAMLDTFGSHAAPELAEVFARAGRTFVRAAALDPRPDMRSLACAQLIRNPEPRDTELLLELLADPLQEVELAAIEAVGQGRLEAARTELLVRARLAEPVLRRAALRAIGSMGGEGVLDALVVSLSDRSPEVVRGAAEGLAELGDPETATLLVSLLSRGRASEVFEPARLGLLRLGETAWPDLLRAVNTPGHRAGREAALVLSLQGVVESAPALMTMLTENPADAFIARELAVLTCIDMRKEGDPQKSWWDWWDDVVHDDSLVWLCAAMERRGVRAPPPEELRAGTRAGTLFLLDVVAREDARDAHVVERARRELARLLGSDPGGAPLDHDQRVSWVAGIRGQLELTWE